MKKSTIVAGIDVSKLKLDVSTLINLSEKKPQHFVVGNSREGILRMFKELGKKALSLKDILFCFEHTGVYTYHLCSVLQECQYSCSLVPAIVIKR